MAYILFNITSANNGPLASHKENAEAYLQMCAENNKRPKFYKLLDYDGEGTYSLKKDGSTDGYWKLLVDFKMYDNNGNGSPQMPVTPNFNMEESTKMLNEYEGGHAQYPVAHGVVDRFVKEYNSSNTIKYSDRNVDNYTEKEYNNYGWARANDILTAAENERLRSLFAMATTKQSKPPQTSRGEMMFAVGEEVDNKIVFMKGTIENPQITKIIEFYLYDEMELDVERRKTYALERAGIERQVGELFETHVATDFGYKLYEERNRIQVKRDNNELGIDRGRGSITIEQLTDTLTHSDRSPDDVSFTTRSLLADALESTAQNEAEKEKLAEYKGRIDMLNAEEKKLAGLKSELKELTFGKGAKDPARAKALREEIVKTENRINLHDKKLLQLEI